MGIESVGTRDWGAVGQMINGTAVSLRTNDGRFNCIATNGLECGQRRWGCHPL